MEIVANFRFIRKSPNRTCGDTSLAHIPVNISNSELLQLQKKLIALSLNASPAVFLDFI